MRNIFNNSTTWEDKDKNTTGKNRPFVELDDDFIKSLKFRIAKKIPVPWQSMPYLKDGGVFKIIYDNENLVVKNNLCGYCGIAILDDELVVRWTNKNFLVINENIQEPRVTSDIMPMHKECMKIARVFCPHMIKTSEDEYEYGLFKDLKNNALKDIKDKKTTPPN